jgi:GT2 family glycosyltransferase
MDQISVVIPTWNRAKLLESALSNLEGQTLRPSEIIVVDNGSVDDTVAVVQAHSAHLIRFQQNRGFAPAVNVGVQHASGDWIVILNNDVVLPPGWLATLHSAATSTNAAFCAGKLLSHDAPDIIDGTWDLLSRGGHAWRCGFDRKDGFRWSQPRTIDFAPMTAAMFHRRVFEQVGLVDERFEAYYEDVDFGLRCALAGLRGVYEPSAVARHLGKSTLGKNSGRVFFLTARNQIFLLAKHYGPATLRKWMRAVVAGQAISFAGAARNGHLISAARGIWEGLRRWKEMRESPAQPARLEPLLARCEDEILALQNELGFEPYWRLYFRLVRSG